MSEDEARVDWFRGTSSWVWATLGGVIAVGVIVMDILGGWHPEVTALTIFCAVLLYLSLLRPAVGVTDEHLVLRHMVSEQHIPLAGVEEIEVTRMLKVRAGARKFINPAVSRSMRQVRKNKRRTHDPVTGYADYVEERLRTATTDALRREGISPDSTEQGHRGEQVRQLWSWPEIAALAGSAILLALAFLLS